MEEEKEIGKSLVPSKYKMNSLADMKEFVKGNPWALYSAETLRLMVQCLPVVGGSLGELLKKGIPNAEMDLMTKHLQDLSGRIDEIGIKVEKLKNPAIILLIRNTIEESVNDDAGDKWEFYKNLLLHSLSDKDVRQHHIYYYKEKIRENSTLELIGLANLFKNPVSQFIDLSDSRTIGQMNELINATNKGANSDALRSLGDLFRYVAPKALGLGNDALNDKILADLIEKKYLLLRNRSEGLSFGNLRPKFNDLFQDKPVALDDLMRAFDISLGPLCFAPWVLEFTKTIAVEPPKQENPD